MTVKCTFCNDTKQEPGIPGPCVWCEQVVAAPVAVGYQFAKGFTDPVGDCEKFEAGITVNSWLQRIVIYGDSPADAEALRDHIMLSAEREAALREELAALRESYEAMRDRKNSIVYLQQRLTSAEQRAEDLKKLLCDVINEAPTGFAALKVDLANRVNDALKPAAEGEGS